PRRGFVSNPNFRLSDPNIQPDLKGNPSDIFSEDRAKLLSENKGEPSKGDTGKVDLAALAGDDDEGVPTSSSFVFGKKPVKGVTGSIPPSPTGSLDEDSMVPLGREPAGGSSGDSRVRLDSPSGRLPDMGVHLVDFDMKPISDPPSSRKLVPPPIPGGSGRLAGGSGKLGDSGRKTPPPKQGVTTSSEFELKPTAAGPNDSIFDFSTPSMDNIELELTPEQQELVDLGGAPSQSPEKGGSMRAKLPPIDEESSTFELNLEPSSSEELAVLPRTPRPSGGPKDTSSEFDLSLQVPEESSSDFELNVEDESSDTMSALDSSADTSSASTARIPTDEVVVGEDSDFELALDDDAAIVDETGSEVVVIDEEEGTDVMTGGAAAGAAALAGAGLGRRGKGAVEEDEIAFVEPYGEDDHEPARAPARASEWGWMSLLHLPTALIMIFTGFLLFEMVRSIAGYETKSVIAGTVFDLVKKITN
ncbi:MAG TPA: hypothetical protein PKD72_04215, partial [Gemmatales bacterium]|nr:hypothetical protein [Gemmatales bacterium]